MTARSYDAMIAAVAVANDLPLYTAKPDDFEAIEGLTVVPISPLTEIAAEPAAGRKRQIRRR